MFDAELEYQSVPPIDMDIWTKETPQFKMWTT